MHTGLRRGEALALQWSDVDLTHGLLRVRGALSHIHGALVVSGPKSARSKRVVPLSRPTCRLLHDVRDALAARRT